MSKTKTRTRRAHDFIVATQSTSCPQCGEPKLPHHICRCCGYYKGREIVEGTLD